MPGNSLIGSLAVNLTMETAAFQKGATIAEKRANALKSRLGGAAGAIKGFGVALVGSLAVGAFASAISKGLEYASSLGEVAQQLGVTTGELQKYRFAASQVGLEQSEMDAGLAKLSRTIGEAIQGSKPLAAAFGKIGISIDELRGKSVDEVMKMIADGLQGIASPAERAAILVDLFGRAGQKLAPLLAGGRAGIDALGDAYKKLNIEISPENIAKADAAKDKMAALQTVLSAKIAGIVAENSDAIIKMVEALAGLAVALATGIGKIAEWVGALDASLAPAQKWADDTDAMIVKWARSTWASFEIWWNGLKAGFQNMRETVEAALIGVYNGVKTWLVDKLKAAIGEVKAAIQSVGDKFKWLYDVVVGHSYVPDMVDQVGEHMRRLDDEMGDPALTATEKVAEGFANMARSAIGAVQGIVAAIKNGDWLSAIDQAIGIIGQLIGAVGGLGGYVGRGLGSGGADLVGHNILGMARGGSFKVGGMPGVDRNLLSINGSPVARVSRGEIGRIGPNNDNGGGSRVMVVPSPYFDLVVQENAARVAAPMAHNAAAAGSIDARATLARRQQRAFP